MNCIVSIIVPIYNTEKYLEKCLSSIKNQTYENLEVILVNDGSTDTSPIIAERYCNNDDRFKLFNQKNQGPGPAKTFGIKKATGKYLIVIDSDDWIEKDFIFEFMKLAEKKDLDVIFCDQIVELENGKVIEIKKLSNFSNCDNQDIIKLHITSRMPWGAQHKLVKRSIVTKCNAEFSKVISGEELKYSMKILINSKKMGFMSNSYYHYLERQGSQSKKHRIDYYQNIDELKQLLISEKLIEEYINEYNIFVIRFLILEIYNQVKEDNLTSAYKKSKEKIKSYYEKYNIESMKNIELYYAELRIRKMYFLLKHKMVFMMVVLSKIYLTYKKYKNQ